MKRQATEEYGVAGNNDNNNNNKIDYDVQNVHRHYKRFMERMTEEMGLQMFPENRY